MVEKRDEMTAFQMAYWMVYCLDVQRAHSRAGCLALKMAQCSAGQRDHETVAQMASQMACLKVGRLVFVRAGYSVEPKAEKKAG